ncbi:MAG TPA: caleosin family protein [Coprobacter fastidiosus]|nr:caleosin family protein [Coprobacter fastidiosus]
MRRNIITDFYKSVRNIKFRIITMSVRTIMIQGNKTIKFSRPHAIIDHVFLGIIRAVHRSRMGSDSLFMLTSGDYIHNPSHCIRSI